LVLVRREEMIGRRARVAESLMSDSKVFANLVLLLCIPLRS